MSKLKVPSLQHLAGLWDPDPRKIATRLLALATKGPPFSYDQLNRLVLDVLGGSVPFEQVLSAVEYVKHPLARKNYREILPLVRSYKEMSGATSPQLVTPRYYPVGRDLRILVNPPLIYLKNGEVQLPWFIYWKTNLLNERRLALFVALMRDVLKQDPDLEGANFHLVVLSQRRSEMARSLTIIDAATVPSLSDSEKLTMLGAFAQGYALAMLEWIGSNRAERQGLDRPDDNLGQTDLPFQPY